MLAIISCKAAVIDYSNITPWSVIYTVESTHDSNSWPQDWNSQRAINNNIGWGLGNRRVDSSGMWNAWNNENQWNPNNNRVEQRINANQHISVDGQPWSSNRVIIFKILYNTF